MDHIETFREKIASLRYEIAQIIELNDQYRRHSRKDHENKIAHDQRLERLLQIQHELAQLAGVDRQGFAFEEKREGHRSRIHLVKKAS